MPAIHLSAEKFDEVINSGKVVLIDFWATWCRPCQMMGPIVDELAEQYQGQAIIAKMNVDDESVSKICERYGITTIPNFKVFKNGVEINNLVGALPKNTLQSIIEKSI